jgi:hypothetical protein
MTMLSKSRYMAGLQCPKRLWFEANARDRVPEVDAATQAIFEQGHEVGRLAQGLFPGGLEIDRERLGWEGALAATSAALAQRIPIHEAAFAFEGAACRVDVLVPVEGVAWDLVEVKSTTKVKDEHVEDVAFQTWVLRGAGVPLRRSLLCHLDSTYVRRGPLELDRLFELADLTDKVSPALVALPPVVRRLKEVMALPTSPEIAIGPHCSDPYECPLTSLCWAEVPDESVFTLYRGGRKCWDLFASGIERLLDIPDGCALTENQAIQVAAARAGSAHVDRSALLGFLGELEHPLHYFDLETYAPAIPPFDETRPYQQIPFQFSLHVLEAPGAALRSVAFLAEGPGDPRPALLAAARDAIAPAGSVVAFNAGFERRCLEESVLAWRAYAPWVEDLLPRFVDLLEPFRKFSYYHPAQLGSASLKSVLPVLSGGGYGHLEIQDGGAAAREFLRTLDPATGPEERQRIRAALLAYCGRDTEGMVEVVEALRALIAGRAG